MSCPHLRLRSASRILAIAVACLVFLCPSGVRAQTPTVTIGPSGVKVRVESAPLGDVIDALSLAAGFRVTYAGARPTAMLYNTEIETPTVAETLARVLAGQDVNYGAVFDLSGRNVTTLMMLGPATPTGGPSAPSGRAPARPFSPPSNPRNDLPPVDDDPAEMEDSFKEPATPEPSPTLEPPPASPETDEVKTVPLPPSPFSPRPLVISPFAPRPTPPPAPSPLS